MKRVILDGKLMTNKIETHKYLKSQLSICGYCGNNLDALWDVLSIYDKSISIELINCSILVKNLGGYGEALIKTFEDAAMENTNIKYTQKITV